MQNKIHTTEAKSPQENFTSEVTFTSIDNKIKLGDLEGAKSELSNIIAILKDEKITAEIKILTYQTCLNCYAAFFKDISTISTSPMLVDDLLKQVQQIVDLNDQGKTNNTIYTKDAIAFAVNIARCLALKFRTVELLKVADSLQKTIQKEVLEQQKLPEIIKNYIIALKSLPQNSEEPKKKKIEAHIQQCEKFLAEFSKNPESKPNLLAEVKQELCKRIGIKHGNGTQIELDKNKPKKPKYSHEFLKKMFTINPPLQFTFQGLNHNIIDENHTTLVPANKPQC